MDCTPIPLRDICERLTESPDDSGYVCLSEGSSEYLRCHLTEKVATMMACAAGTRCKAPVGVFQVYSPCLWESYSEYPDIYPRDAPKAARTLSDSSDGSAYIPEKYNYSVYCELFGKTGYFCSGLVNPRAGRDEFVYCDAGSSQAFQLACSPGAYCNLDWFSAENPCAGRSPEPDEAVCGDGVLGAGEECEAGGFGCDPETCKCKEGFFPPSTLDGNCVLNYTEVCAMVWKNAKGGDGVESYYFCPHFYDPSVDSSVVARCLADGVATFEECPESTFCTSSALTTESPCASAAPACGNGKVEMGEECEAGGVGCNPSTCKCEDGYRPAEDEISVNCIKDVGPQDPPASYDELCESFKIPGYFCAAVFDSEKSAALAVQCGANGAFSGVFDCPAGTTCRAKGFTIYNPCNVPPAEGSEEGPAEGSASSQCEGVKECDAGGTGCDEKGCKCRPGFRPTAPPTESCVLSDYSKICLSHGLGKNATLALCIEGYDDAFLICSSDGAADSFMTSCPPGTKCTTFDTPIDGMPCTADTEEDKE